MKLSALLSVVLFAMSGCDSTEPEAATDGGGDSAADAPTHEAATETGVDAGDCPTSYDLASYSGDAGGLCPPEDATMCSCFELTAAEQVTCDPTGAGCVKLPGLCDVCGWVNCTDPTPTDPQECAQYEAILPGIRAGATTLACSQDFDCGTGRTCTLRIGNRMFCE